MDSLCDAINRLSNYRLQGLQSRVAKDIKKQVGDRIRELREEKDWSQEKLAEKASLHRTYIGQVERGEKNIGIENLVRIAGGLGVGLTQLLKGI